LARVTQLALQDFSNYFALSFKEIDPVLVHLALQLFLLARFLGRDLVTQLLFLFARELLVSVESVL